MRLTLRTLLAYLDDTLPPAEATVIGRKVAESENARELIEKIKKLTRKRGLATPSTNRDDSYSNPNTVAEYLSDALSSDGVTEFESACLKSEVNLAEAAACHQILTLLLSEPARVPPTARKRMYELVKGPESLPNRKLGMTVPVGGMPAEVPKPDSGDHDAGLLLGLSPTAVGLRWGLTFILACLAIIATWLAWPRFTAVTPSLVEEVANPVPKIEGPKQSLEKETLPLPMNSNPKPQEDEPKPVPEVKPVPVPDAPKFDLVLDSSKKSIGKVVSKDQVVVASSTLGMWSRIADGSAVSTADRLVCLPGYKGKVLFDSNVLLDLWSNLPDQIPLGPLGSAITCNVPAAGLAADISLQNGRVYVSSAQPNGATVRLRIGDAIVDVKLENDQSELAIERVHHLSRGLLTNPMTPVVSTWSLAVIRGSAKVQFKPSGLPIVLKSGEGLEPNQNVMVDGAKKLTKQFVYPDAIQSAAAQKALISFSSALTPMDRVLLKLSEAANRESSAAARAAVFGQASLGDVVEVATALFDTNRPHVRDAAAVALRTALAENPSLIEPFTKTMIDKSGLTADQSESVLALLRGPDLAERKSAEVLRRLVDGIMADVLPIRELSHRVLLLEVDPESIRNPVLARFDPLGSTESREACQKLWRKRVDELIK